MSPHRSSQHPDERRLAGLAAGDEDREVSIHLEDCPQCRRSAEELQALMNLLGQAASLVEPPGWFRTRALAAIRRRREQGSAWSGFLRVLHDSVLSPVPSLVRGPAAPGRQLLHQGDGIELDLRFNPPEEERPGRVTGQIHLSAPERPDAPDALTVEITDALGAIATARPDRFGMFSIAGHFRPPLIVTIRSPYWVEEAFVPEVPA